MENITKCGIVMPISEIEDCKESHWKDLLSIYKDCIIEIGLLPNLVSDADDSGVILRRIIDNLYSNPIVICDISCRNPNVMFELGIRLAFDKPTIIIKDDKTPFSFDTSIIEHLIYPRDLNYYQIKNFREQLKLKIQGTLSESQSNSDYSTFLKHFGQYKIVKLKESEISSDAFIIKSLNELNDRISQLTKFRSISNKNELINVINELEINYVFVDFSEFNIDSNLKKIPFNVFETFRDFLDDIYFLLNGKVKPFTYEFDWILLNLETGEEIKSKRSINKIPKGRSFQDSRTLNEVGIHHNSTLKVHKR